MDFTRPISQQLRVDTSVSGLCLITNFLPNAHASVPQPKLAIFDLDDTLITSKSNSRHLKDAEDWQFKYPSVPEILKALENSGYVVCVVTNQLGVSQGHLELSLFRKVIEAVLSRLQISAYVLAATDDDEFRKPAIGAFEHLMEYMGKKPPSYRTNGVLGKREALRELGGGDSRAFPNQLTVCQKLLPKRKFEKPKDTMAFQIDTFYIKAVEDNTFGLGYDISPESFYCGDAAGRSSEEGTDFSCSDILFAVNTHIHFALPEQIFLNTAAPPAPELPTFSFSELIMLDEAQFRKELRIESVIRSSRGNTVTLLIGPPGCGKTHLANTYFPNCTIVSYVS